MAIYEVLDDNILQRCENCMSANLLALDDLLVGVEHEGKTDERIVPLPACSACGSGEYLIRTAKEDPEHPVPGSFGHLHRLLVDHVHAELVRRKRVASSLRERTAESLVAKTVADTAFRRWFPQGLKLMMPEGPREAPPGKGPPGR